MSEEETETLLDKVRRAAKKPVSSREWTNVSEDENPARTNRIREIRKNLNS